MPRKIFKNCPIRPKEDRAKKIEDGRKISPTNMYFQRTFRETGQIVGADAR